LMAERGVLSDWTLETGVSMSAMYVGVCKIDAFWTNRHSL